MSKKIVVIGGTACGPKTAARARRCDSEAKITLVEQSDNLSSATCGFPYYVGKKIKERSALNVVPATYFKDVFNVDYMLNTRAVSIDPKEHKVRVHSLKSGEFSDIDYDKLVITTGSSPIKLNCAGSGSDGIFPLWVMEDAVRLREIISKRHIKKVTVIGAGLIGIEIVEAFVELGLWVTCAEALDCLLPKLLDFEIAAHVERHLRQKGVNLLLGARVKGFQSGSDGWVTKVITEDGDIDTDLVVTALGTRPNSQLAVDAGLAIGSTGGILVNSHLQTSDPDIYAGGDCVESTHRVTQQKVLVPMGSTANKHGRVIGTNITGGDDTFPGVLGTSVAKAFDYNIGRVGITEKQAIEANYDIETSLVPAFDHATYYPGARKFLIKMIVDKKTKKVLGAQAVGCGEVAKRIDVIATAISLGATIDEIANLDLAYAPPYNSAMDPVHNAINVVRNKIDGLAETCTPMDLKNKIDNCCEDFIFLDVRTAKEKDNCYIEAPSARLIPLQELRANIDSLPKDEEIIICCRTSIRAYQAFRILKGFGFRKVKFLDGSIGGWPFETQGPKTYDEI